MSHLIFTSESVCAGHPDKICDSISDAILDEVLTQDKFGRVAVETLATKNKVIIAGEVTSHAKVNYKKIAQERIRYLGYTDPALEFTDESPIEVYIHEQSPDIAQVIRMKGAGDQGIMYGYACSDWTNYAPLPLTLAHTLAQKIDEARDSKALPYLKPDGKTQVTLEYKNGRPYKVRRVVIAVPHKKNSTLRQVKEDMYRKIVVPVLDSYGFKLPQKDLIVNGTGAWHFSGPAADTGLTGRKIVVDTYGGVARVGGGCFSGKDPTKVDRSGAYAARYIAKNIVAQQLAERAEVRLAYYIGARAPLMQEVATFGTAKKKESVINDFAKKLIDTSVEGIIDTLNLRRPIYLKTATYGHFGREGFPWEKIVQDI